MVSEAIRRVETPAYVVDLGALRRNLALLADVQERAGCTILLALKAFAMWSVFPLVRAYLPGVAASSLHEARLGREQFGGEVHAYAPAFTEAGLAEIVTLADHVIFNSLTQWQRLRPVVQAAGARVSCGLRVNPEHSEVKVAAYDPCGRFSRLGVTRARLEGADLAGLDGLHFHTLCELDADALERTLAAFEAAFGDLLPRMAWVNFGGGHHITRAGYDVDRLVRVVRAFRARWGCQVYLEPGEAIALETGFLVATVLDVIHNEMDTAILDTSASAHMPDVLEMPYRPRIIGAGEPMQLRHTYRLGGLTCMAGDVIGDYSFPEPLTIGSTVIFCDMAHYSMVKNTTFNGVALPGIATWDPATAELKVVRRFGYDDYKNRLS